MTATTPNSNFSPDAAAIEAALQAAGFERKGKGFRRDDLTFEAKSGWFVIRKPLDPNADPNDWLGRPGLWKPARFGRKEACVAFPFPEFALGRPSSAPFADAERCPFQACLEWALATADGERPKGWTAPEADELEDWHGGGQALTVQKADVVRQIELTREPEVFTARLRLESAIPGELPEPQRRWLHRLLAEGRDQWRLARTGLEFHDVNADSADDRDDNEGRDRRSDAVAEVNLTGVPAPCAHRLFLASVDTLRWIAAALVPTAEFLASDAAQASSALEIGELKG